MAALAQFAMPHDSNQASGRNLYFQCLNRVQKYQLRIADASEGPYVDFRIDDPATRTVVESLMRSPDLLGATNCIPIASDKIPRIIDRLSGGFDLLRDYSAEINETVRDLIAWIIFVGKEGYVGGSFWHILGAIWMSPEEQWSTTDYAENLLHETVHQAMFLEDMVHGLFAVPADTLCSEDALIMSSIRKTRRPYDYSFHAATVSTTLIEFYEYIDMPMKATQLCESLLPTLNELREKRSLLSSHGAELLTTMECLISQSPAFRRISGRAGLLVS